MAVCIHLTEYARLPIASTISLIDNDLEEKRLLFGHWDTGVTIYLIPSRPALALPNSGQSRTAPSTHSQRLFLPPNNSAMVLSMCVSLTKVQNQNEELEYAIPCVSSELRILSRQVISR